MNIVKFYSGTTGIATQDATTGVITPSSFSQDLKEDVNEILIRVIRGDATVPWSDIHITITSNNFTLIDDDLNHLSYFAGNTLRASKLFDSYYSGDNFYLYIKLDTISTINKVNITLTNFNTTYDNTIYYITLDHIPNHIPNSQPQP